MDSVFNRKAFFTGIVLLVVFLSYPFLYYLISIVQFASVNPSDSIELIFNRRLGVLLGRSYLLSACVTIAAAMVALPLAYCFANYNFPLKKLFQVLLLLPFFLPPYVSAISWIQMFGDGGLFRSFNVDFYGFWSSVFVLTCWLYPLSFIFFSISLRRNRLLEDAGILFSNRSKRFFKIVLPLVSPGILAGMLITFILALTNFSVPGALRLNIFTSEIFIQFGVFYNHQKAFFISFPVVVVSGVLIYILSFRIGKQLRKVGQNIDFRPTKDLPIFQRIIFSATLTLLIIVFVMLPIYSLIAGTQSLAIFKNTFITNFNVLTDSLIHTFLTSIPIALIGIFFAWFRRRLNNHILKSLLDLLVFIHMIIPGTVYGIIGVAFFQNMLFSKIHTIPVFTIFFSSLKYISVSYIVCIAGFTRLPEKYLDYARLVSFSKWKIFRSIVYPLTKHALIGSFLAVFVFIFGELDTAIMILPPGFETMPLRIFSMLHYGAIEMVYALSLVQALIILLFFLLGFSSITKTIHIYA